MKIYTFQVEITEGSDEFWEDITKRSVSGCDEIPLMIEDYLCAEGFFHLGDNCKVNLVKFGERGPCLIQQ